MDKRRDILLKLALTATNVAELLEQLAAAEEVTVEVTTDAETLGKRLVLKRRGAHGGFSDEKATR